MVGGGGTRCHSPWLALVSRGGGECKFFKLVVLWRCHFGKLGGGDDSSPSKNRGQNGIFSDNNRSLAMRVCETRGKFEEREGGTALGTE